MEIYIQKSRTIHACIQILIKIIEKIN